MRRLDSVERIVLKIEGILIGIFSSGALLLACYEMFMRYFFPLHLSDWTSEVVIYLITAAVFLTGGSLIAEGKHVYADLFINKLSNSKRRFLETLFSVTGFIFGSVMSYASWEVVEFSYILGEKSDSSLQLPIFIYYLIIPISFVLISLHYGARTLRILFDKSKIEEVVEASHEISNVD